MLGHHTITFTLREASCIRQILEGKKPAEIAENLKISQRSVAFYLRNGKRKLDLLIEHNDADCMEV